MLLRLEAARGRLEAHHGSAVPSRCASGGLSEVCGRLERVENALALVLAAVGDPGCGAAPHYDGERVSSDRRTTATDLVGAWVPMDVETASVGGRPLHGAVEYGSRRRAEDPFLGRSSLGLGVGPGVPPDGSAVAAVATGGCADDAVEGPDVDVHMAAACGDSVATDEIPVDAVQREVVNELLAVWRGDFPSDVERATTLCELGPLALTRFASRCRRAGYSLDEAIQKARVIDAALSFDGMPTGYWATASCVRMVFAGCGSATAEHG